MKTMTCMLTTLLDSTACGINTTCSLSTAGASVLITLVICVTLIIICSIICCFMQKNRLGKEKPDTVDYNIEREQSLQLKRMEKEAKMREEYTTRLLNFMEKMAVRSEETKDGDKIKSVTRDFDYDKCDKYIKLLQKIIDGITQENKAKNLDPQ